MSIHNAALYAFRVTVCAHALTHPPFSVLILPLVCDVQNKDPTKAPTLRATWTQFFPEGLLSCALSPDSKTAACSLRDGRVVTLNSDKGQILKMFDLPRNDDVGKAAVEYPACTCIRFRPENENTPSKNVMALGRGDQLIYLHGTTGKLLSTLDEPGNSILGLDFSSCGSRVATVGEDRVVRLYDDKSRRLITSYADSQSAGQGRGHNNTVFSTAFMPGNENILVSAGWDNMMFVWDARQAEPAAVISGVYACGPDAIDVDEGGTIVSGSWRRDHTLQLWDLRKGQLSTNLIMSGVKEGPVKCYVARVGRKPGKLAGIVGAGGSGEEPKARFFNKDGSAMGTLSTNSAVLSISMCANTTKAIVCQEEALSMTIVEV